MDDGKWRMQNGDPPSTFHSPLSTFRLPISNFQFAAALHKQHDGAMLVAVE
jgi:hypothetical protein